MLIPWATIAKGVNHGEQNGTYGLSLRGQRRVSGRDRGSGGGAGPGGVAGRLVVVAGLHDVGRQQLAQRQVGGAQQVAEIAEI
ncbi:MAG: hypothetical protein WCI74_15990, partial [Actinomycetes bacterium]